MSKKFRPLQKHPGEMSTEELSAALGDLADSEVMRSLIAAEITAVRDGAEREARTMRNLWYSLVKPALSRAGLLNKKTRGGRDVPWDDKLSKYLAEMVRAGQTTYEELSIVDGSRQRQAAVSITSPVASVELVGPHFPWVILFTEKDTIWGVVESLASLYGVSAISGGGQPSNACTENTVRAIESHKAYAWRQPIIVLSLTDYDPAGYSIAKAQFTQVQEVVGTRAEVFHVRLGLLPEQLSPEERAQNAYEPKDAGLSEWLAETGGVDGASLGLELDALPLSRVRSMFAEGIEQVVDLDGRREDLRRAFVDLIACDLLRPDFDASRARLQEAVKQSEMWDSILETPIPNTLFKRAAVEGRDAIDPRDVGLFECEGDVRRLMGTVLERGVWSGL